MSHQHIGGFWRAVPRAVRPTPTRRGRGTRPTLFSDFRGTLPLPTSGAWNRSRVRGAARPSTRAGRAERRRHLDALMDHAEVDEHAFALGKLDVHGGDDHVVRSVAAVGDAPPWLWLRPRGWRRFAIPPHLLAAASSLRERVWRRAADTLWFLGRCVGPDLFVPRNNICERACTRLRQRYVRDLYPPDSAYRLGPRGTRRGRGTHGAWDARQNPPYCIVPTPLSTVCPKQRCKLNQKAGKCGLGACRRHASARRETRAIRAAAPTGQLPARLTCRVVPPTAHAAYRPVMRITPRVLPLRRAVCCACAG